MLPQGWLRIHRCGGRLPTRSGHNDREQPTRAQRGVGWSDLLAVMRLAITICDIAPLYYQAYLRRLHLMEWCGELQDMVDCLIFF